MKRFIIVFLLLVPTASPAQVGPDVTRVDFAVDTPVDPMLGVYHLPWEVHEYDHISFTTTAILSVPGQPPVGALHRMDALGAWLLSLSLPSPGPLPPTFVEARDVLRYVPGVGYSLFFCGASASPALPANADVDAVDLDGGDGGDLILSVDVPVQVGAGTWALPADLLRYTRTAPGCAGWSYSGKAFDSAAAGDGIPTSTNLVGAYSVGGTLLFVVDTPTSLTPSASSPDIYRPKEIVTWDGAMFDRFFSGGSDPFLAAYPPSTALSAITGLESAPALAAPGSDMLIAVDTAPVDIQIVAVNDIDAGGMATSKVTSLAPRPWDTGFGQVEGSVAVSDDFGRTYLMMDGQYHIGGVDPPTGAVVDTFTSMIYGDGLDLDLDGAGTTLHTTTTLGQIVAIDLVPGPTFGDMTVLATGLGTPMGIAVEETGTYAYVADHMGSQILRVELSSGTSSVVATLASPPRAVAIADAVFLLLAAVSDSGDLVIVDGDPMSPGYGTITPVLSGLSDPTSAEAGAARLDGVIVTDAGTGEILSVNANSLSPDFGTSITLASGLGSPGGVATLPAPSFAMLPCESSPPTGSTIATCAYAATGAAALGSYGATLSWDPTKLSFAGFGAGDPPFDTPVVNTSNTASGTLSFSDADATGVAGTAHLLCAEFDVIGARTGPGQTIPLNLTMTSAFDSGLNSLLPGAVVADHPIDITAACTIGDPVADTFTNSGDALAILRHEVGLFVPAAVANLLQALCGDLNGDGKTDSTDANVALTVEVGLPVDPMFPIGQSNVITDTCASGSCAGQPVPLAAPPILGLEAGTADPVVARLRVDAPKILPGDTFDLIVEVDTGARTLGSFAALLSWETEAASMTAVAGGQGNTLGSPTINATEAGSGKLRFAAASPPGASGTVELLRMTLTAKHALPRPERIFDLEFGSMAATGPGFESLLPVLEIAAPAGSKRRP